MAKDAVIVPSPTGGAVSESNDAIVVPVTRLRYGYIGFDSLQLKL